MTLLPVTSIYAALMGLFLIPITIRVGLRRVQTKVFSGHGDDETLNRRIRAHGNFLEYVPFALFLIALTELSAAPPLFVHSLGAVLSISRIMHYFTLINSPVAVTREISMLGTILVFLLGSGWLLYFSFNH